MIQWWTSAGDYCWRMEERAWRLGTAPQGQATEGLVRLKSAEGSADNGEAAWEVALARLWMPADDEQKTAGSGAEQAQTRASVKEAAGGLEEPTGSVASCVSHA